MRIAVVSDIHGNLPALEATLAAIAREGVSEILCLGDVVGYGADPATCLELVWDACSVLVRANHEDALLERNGRQEVNAAIAGPGMTCDFRISNVED